MSVPEGKMRMDLGRHEIWLVASLLNCVMNDLVAPGEALKDLNKPILRRMNSYLEATNGEIAAYLPSYPETEERVG